MKEKLGVTVGDDVTTVDRDGPVRIVKVTNVTPSGMIDADGERWNADGSSRARVSAWQVSKIQRTTPEHRERLARNGLANKCTRAFDAIGVVHASEVATMNADDIRQAIALIEQLTPILAKRKR